MFEAFKARRKAKKRKLCKAAERMCGIGYGGDPRPYVLPGRNTKGYMRNGG